MELLIGALGLGGLCVAWVVLQSFVRRMDSDVGKNPHCGGKCSPTLEELETRDAP